MTRHLAVEWGEKGVRLMCVAPGPIAATEGFSRLGNASAFFFRTKNSKNDSFSHGFQTFSPQVHSISELHGERWNDPGFIQSLGREFDEFYIKMKMLGVSILSFLYKFSLAFIIKV